MNNFPSNQNQMRNKVEKENFLWIEFPHWRKEAGKGSNTSETDFLVSLLFKRKEEEAKKYETIQEKLFFPHFLNKKFVFFFHFWLEWKNWKKERNEIKKRFSHFASTNMRFSEATSYTIFHSFFSALAKIKNYYIFRLPWRAFPQNREKMIIQWTFDIEKANNLLGTVDCTQLEGMGCFL